MDRTACSRAHWRIGLVIVLVTIVAIPAWAQRSAAYPGVDERLERLQEELELTDEQVDQIRPILADEEEGMRELKNGASDRMAAMQAFRELREETDERIEALLTDEQKERFLELREEQRERIAERRGRGVWR